MRLDLQACCGEECELDAMLRSHAAEHASRAEANRRIRIFLGQVRERSDRAKALDRRDDPELDGMQHPGPHGARKDEQPIVRPGRRCPFELPGLGITEKIEFGQSGGDRFSKGEVGEDLERRTLRIVRVVPRLHQEQALLIAQRVGGRD